MERNVIHRLTATISSGSIISLALAGEAVAQTIGSALVAQQLNYNAGKNLGNWTQRFSGDTSSLEDINFILKEQRRGGGKELRYKIPRGVFARFLGGSSRLALSRFFNNDLLCKYVHDDLLACVSDNSGFGYIKHGVFLVNRKHQSMLAAYGDKWGQPCDSTQVIVTEANEKMNSGNFTIYKNIPSNKVKLILPIFNGMFACNAAQVRKQEVDSSLPHFMGAPLDVDTMPWRNIEDVTRAELK